jgi:GNAT superfamily N-acetyltransferase
VDDLRLTIVAAGSDPAQQAMRRYFQELDARFPGGFDPGDALKDAEVSFIAPKGVFLVAQRAQTTLGCGAISWLDADTAEIKRMWVSDAARGQGLGRRLLDRLEDEVRRSGRRRVVLDTHAVLIEAIAMYHRAGYREVPDYNGNPYAQLWFEKTLPELHEAP